MSTYHIPDQAPYDRNFHSYVANGGSLVSSQYTSQPWGSCIYADYLTGLAKLIVKIRSEGQIFLEGTCNSWRNSLKQYQSLF